MTDAAAPAALAGAGANVGVNRSSRPTGDLLAFLVIVAMIGLLLMTLGLRPSRRSS